VIVNANRGLVGEFENMRKLFSTAIALLAVGTFAFAGEIQTAEGTVQDISGNTVTIEGENGEVLSFESISGSKVIAVGAAHVKRNLAAVRLRPTMRDFVRKNQVVTVTYWEEDGTLFIKKLRIH
jgi:hypothetical protein